MAEADGNSELSSRLRAVLRPATLLFIVPPFAWLDRPALNVHLLQGMARRAGHEAQVLYTNAMFAASFGERTAATLSNLQYGWFLGERLFARTAFGGQPLGDGGASLHEPIAKLERKYADARVQFNFGVDVLLALEARTPEWIARIANGIVERGYRIVGATSSFEQIASALALLDAVKTRAPTTTTIIGGANCEGPMAHGIVSLGSSVDHVFSGEAETTFPAWLAAVLAGTPQPKILDGAPCEMLDDLPTPDYDDYRAQIAAFLPESDLLSRSSLTYETSRGCWWGQKSHCTFCGLNGQGMASRQKSPERVLEELPAIVARHPTRMVTMTDNIMPHSFHRTVLPHLQERVPGLRVMYEEKANLSLRQVIDLVAAGVDEIQPGIESLSTELLALMAKGTTCAQNLALLRYAAATGLKVQWNILYGFPGDSRAPYEEMRELLPLLHHLPPPRMTIPVQIDRFSPYHDRPEQYGIRDLRPVAGYRAWTPAGADLERLAYHFDAAFPSESLAALPLIAELYDEIQRWRERYFVEPAVLRVERDGGGFTLVDTRGIPGLAARQSLDLDRARAATVRQPLTSRSPAIYWALEQRVCVVRDRRYVPLAIASPELLLELEAETPARELRVVG